MIELTAGDGHKFSAYRADPPDAPKGAVVILQEGLGINPHIRAVADAFAAKGYVAIAPSLLDSVKPGIELGYDKAGLSEGANLIRQVDSANVLGEIQSTVDAAKSAGKVAVIGYGWGGYLAYAASNQVNGLACAIGYYGGGIVENSGEKRKIPTLLHFGENDPQIPIEEMIQFRARRPDVSVFSYPGAASGFNCDACGSYLADAAHAALERTEAWIFQYVEGQPPVLLKNAGAYAQAKVDKKKKKKDAGDDLGPPMD
ncbi:dienelactone hydrolase family protein [soil metagenome]